MLRQKWLRSIIALLSVMVMVWPLQVLADSAASANYKVDETFFGTGGSINACSSGPTGYCSNQSLGETGVGNPSSANYQAHAGFNTTTQPYLYFVVSNSNINLGLLSVASTATANASFTVRTYDAGGYVVQTEAPPPTNGEGHTMTTYSSPRLAAAGAEEFGMNLVANTSPTTFGANPVITTVSGTAAGGAASGYNTPNQYKYVQGDKIAESTSPGDTTGEADYTISYIFDIDGGTPAGSYTFNDILVATPTY